MYIDTWKDEDYKIAKILRIKRLLVWVGLLLCSLLFWWGVFMLFSSRSSAETIVIKQEFVAGYSLDHWADSIRLTEGNPNYGILSIKCPLTECRHICKNTVRNNWKHYKKQGKSDLDGFITFLASKYCPTSVDPIGHSNWIKNMKFFLRKDLTVKLKQCTMRSL